MVDAVDAGGLRDATPLFQPIDTFARWFHWGEEKHNIGRSTFYNTVVPMIALCRKHLKTIRWSDRLKA